MMLVSMLRFRGEALIPGAGKRAISRPAYKLHLGERSNDLRRLPIASCRQCQISALWFVGTLPALCFGSLLLVCRRGVASGTSLALAFRQCRSATFLTVSGLVVGGSAGIVSAGTVFAAGTIISVSARALGSFSLSDFAGSFSANAGSISL